jgi:hypothetical protein
MADYDMYPRVGTSDAGSPSATGGAAAATGLTAGTIYNVRVPLTAGVGTALDISVPIAVKSRLIDASVLTTTTVTSAVVGVFTAASGGGTAATSSMAAAAAGRTRDALTTATVVFAKDATCFVRQSGGATLSGGEVNLTFQVEQ